MSCNEVSCHITVLIYLFFSNKIITNKLTGGSIGHLQKYSICRRIGRRLLEISSKAGPLVSTRTLMTEVSYLDRCIHRFSEYILQV